MLPVPLDCLFLIAPSVFSNNYYLTFLFRKWKLIISKFVRFILSQLFLNFISHFASFPLKNLICILTGYTLLSCILYYRKGSIFTHIDYWIWLNSYCKKRKVKTWTFFISSIHLCAIVWALSFFVCSLHCPSTLRLLIMVIVYLQHINVW